MEDLAPDITRQRLLLEGFFDRHIDEPAIREYFERITSELGLRTYGRPIISSPEGTGRVENQGFDAFQPLIDSGISLYVWSARRFLALVIFTCKTFDTDAAKATTIDFFQMPRATTRQF